MSLPLPMPLARRDAVLAQLREVLTEGNDAEDLLLLAEERPELRKHRITLNDWHLLLLAIGFDVDTVADVRRPKVLSATFKRWKLNNKFGRPARARHIATQEIAVGRAREAYEVARKALEREELTLHRLTEDQRIHGDLL